MLQYFRVYKIRKRKVGDFNLNCLNYNKDSNIRHFYHKVFELGFIPLIHMPIRACKYSATIIDNIHTNYVVDNTLKKAIIKSDISDHFPIIFIYCDTFWIYTIYLRSYKISVISETDLFAWYFKITLIISWHNLIYFKYFSC